MQIVVLSENTSANAKLFAEHGLCLYIRHNNQSILFGTGSGGALMENSKRLGLDLNTIKYIVLPHNHSSCAGALDSFAKKYRGVRVFIKAAAAQDCAEGGGLVKARTGVSRSFLSSEKLDCVRFERFCEVCEGFYLVSNLYPAKSEGADRRFMIKNGHKWQRDDFAGECFAVCFPYRPSRGCVILTCCSHTGIAGIIKTVKQMWDVPILAVVGGFGFMGSGINKTGCSAEHIKSTAKELDMLDIGSIYTCHCTGLKGYEIMKELLGDQIQYLHTGEELRF